MRFASTKVTPALCLIEGQVNKHRALKWVIKNISSLMSVIHHEFMAEMLVTYSWSLFAAEC